MADALAISLDEGRPLSLQQQLYTHLREGILAGHLRPGEKVPATRALAAQLAVSRTTAVLAYEQLLAEGYIEARRGAGTFVSRQLPDDTFRAAGSTAAAAARRSGSAPAVDAPSRRATRRLSRWGARVGAYGDSHLRAGEPSTERYQPLPFDFRPGRPDWDAFPHRLWSRLASRRWRRRSADLASYGDPAGYRPLREAVAVHLAQSRGVRGGADQVVVVNGSQQGIDLLVRLWLDPDECAALEEPGYPGAALALRAHGARIAPVPVDEDGLRVDALPSSEAADAPRLVYVTPSHQFPTGATLSLPRRLRLLEWAGRRGALVVEDDYDSEFRYSGRPLESLQGLDSNGVVAYVGSFSKALFPPLRVGFVVLPPGLEAPFVAAKWLADRQTATPDQQVLSDFIQDGHFERHLRRMRRLYGSRRDALLVALREHLGGVVTPGGDGAGLHLIAWLPEGWDARVVAARAARLGVATSPLEPYYQVGGARPGLILGFAALDERRIAEGIRRLARAARG
jgi:GntR family transcriptional regulator / MocR family aminotransferase